MAELSHATKQAAHKSTAAEPASALADHDLGLDGAASAPAHGRQPPGRSNPEPPVRQRHPASERSDCPLEHGVGKRQPGVVLDVYGNDAYAVEFNRPDGTTIAWFSVQRDEVEPVPTTSGT